jgi:electron transfer flavoprotein beta subunit
VLSIATLIKHTPDLTGDRHLRPDMTLDRDAVPGQLSELDEYAVEQSLRVAAAAGDAEVTYVLIGPAAGSEAIRKALSMGGDRAVHVSDDALHGSDAVTTSAVLAAVLQRIGFDLVICGMASTDAGMGVVPAMLAARLGIAQLSFAGQLSVSGDTVSIVRDTDTASEQVEARLPALVSVTDRSGDARYPSFKGIMAAKKKPVTTMSLADLGIDAGAVGTAGAYTAVLSATARPPRVSGDLVKDEGEGGIALAAYLAAHKFI